MKNKFLIITLIGYWSLVIGHSALAVNGVASDPTRPLFSARQLGLGGVAIGFPGDPNTIFTSPANLAGHEFPLLSASSRKITLDETQNTMATWAIPTQFGTFGFGIINQSTGGSLSTARDPATGRIIQNPSLESSSYGSSVIGLAYAKEVNQPLNLILGLGYKSFSQSLSGGGSADQGSGSSFDLSLTAKPLNFLTVGATLQNFSGGAVKWTSTEDKINSFYRVGGAIDLPVGTAGLDFELPTSAYHAGVEYPLARNTALRAGLNPDGLTYGLGFTNGGYRFDYAYVPRANLPGDNPHYFSLSYVGERVLAVAQKLKKKLSTVVWLSPRDRLITDQDVIALSAEVFTTRVLDRKKTWTVTGLSDTSEVSEVTERENLSPFFLNGKSQEKKGITFEASEKLGAGRNVFSLLAYQMPEALAASAEVKILRFTPFADTPLNYWAIEPVALTVTLGLVKGYPDNTFKPDKGISRAELVTLLVRSLSLPSVNFDQLGSIEVFKDVPASSWAFKFVTYGSNAKYVTGYPDGSFKPNKVLSRAEAAAIFARYAGLSEGTAESTAPFPDLKPDFWGNKFIAPAKAAGLLKYLEGKDFAPSTEFTRAEACEVLYRVKAIKEKVEQYWKTGVIPASQ